MFNPYINYNHQHIKPISNYFDGSSLVGVTPHRVESEQQLDRNVFWFTSTEKDTVGVVAVCECCYFPKTLMNVPNLKYQGRVSFDFILSLDYITVDVESTEVGVVSITKYIK